MPAVVLAANVNLTSTIPAVVATINLDPNTVYEIECQLQYSEVNPTDGGFQGGLQVAGASLLAFTDGSGPALNSGQLFSFTGFTGNRTLVLTGTVIVGGAADTLSIIAALAVASANVTILAAGSLLNAESVTAAPTPGPIGGLQAQQICTLARQMARVPGFTLQSGQLLNVILQDLAETYDFAENVRTFPLTFDVATVYQNNLAGAGPNILPQDYLRALMKENIWYLQGVRYVLIIVERDEFDALVQTAGFTSYPTLAYADLNLSAPFAGQKGLMVWPPASGSYTVQIRYYAQPATITTPETSTTVPWFPNTNYLITRLAGELMKLTDDERAKEFLGDGAQGSEGILRKYLNLKDDPEGVVKTVRLDRRHFGSSFRGLPNTKVVGW